MAFNPKTLQIITEEPGVYLMKDQDGKVLYIGKAKNLKARLSQYFTPGRDEREMIPHLVAQIETIDTLVTFSEKEALLLENTLIKKHQPKYNILLKDDKTFIGLMINHKHRWPKISLVRFKGLPPKDALYFGPYTNAYAARQTLETMTQIFKLRQCSDYTLKTRNRPCLLYSIHRCIAPCVNKCTKEEYDQEVHKAIQFLKGKDKEILESLKQEMERASNNLEFEKAASILQTIQQIKQVLTTKQMVVRSKTKDCDAFALYKKNKQVLIMQLIFREGRLVGSEHECFYEQAQTEEEILESYLLQHYIGKTKIPTEILLPMPLSNQNILEELLSEEKGKKVTLYRPKIGEKYNLLKLAEKNAAILFEQEEASLSLQENLLLDMQEALHLTRAPIHIECFDTSNIAGTDLVASMVTYTDGLYNKKKTKLFNIKNVTKSDDYASLSEVLMRHYIKAKEKQELPDLTIVDGGKGQLKIALEVFQKLEIASVDLLSIAKEHALHTKGMTQEKIFLPDQKAPILLMPHSPILRFLQRIRDEAHRVAITHHKRRRKKRTITSALEQIKGIGPKKRKALLTHFGSVTQIKKATEAQLIEVPTITKKDAKCILSYFTHEA